MNIMNIWSKLFAKPKDKLEWTSTISGLIFLVLYFYRTLIADSIVVPILNWIFLRPIEFVAYATMTSAFIIGGLRTIRISSLTLKSSRNLVIGICLALIPLSCSIFSCVWIPHMMKSMRMEPSRLEQFESILERKDFDNERKALLSSIIASEKYRNSGEIIPVFDRHGNIVDYEPTETDKKTVDGINEINSGLLELRKAVYIWCFVLTVSIVLGLKTPIRGSISSNRRSKDELNI